MLVRGGCPRQAGRPAPLPGRGETLSDPTGLASPPRPSRPRHRGPFPGRDRGARPGTETGSSSWLARQDVRRDQADCGVCRLASPGGAAGGPREAEGSGSLWARNPSNVLSCEKAAQPVPAACSRPPWATSLVFGRQPRSQPQKPLRRQSHGPPQGSACPSGPARKHQAQMP